VNLFVDLLEKFFSLLFGDGESAHKGRMMKGVVRDIKGSRFRNFYMIIGCKATPYLAAYFFDLYKDCARLQIKIRNADGTAKLKNTVLYHFLDKEALNIIKELDDEYLDEIFKLNGKKPLMKHLEKQTGELHKKLNKTWRVNVDRCYKTICSFIWFINFDYYALLKNFNMKLAEYSFHENPHFGKINARRIVENIKDFLSVVEGMDAGSGLETAFTVLKKFSPAADISAEYWKRVMGQLQNVLSSTILPLIVRHASEEPEWKTKIIVPQETIAGPFLDRITDNALKKAENILTDEKNIKVSEIIFSLFGSGDSISAAHFFLETRNEQYEGIGIIGFKHAKAFHYCIVFLSLYFEKLKDLCGIFIIYGEWHNKDEMYGLSQAIYDLTVLNGDMHGYDKTLSDSGERGNKIKNMEAGLVRDRQSRHNLSLYIESINDEIFILINRMINSLLCLCVFLNDFQNREEGGPEKILNWKTISDMLKYNGYAIKETEEKAALFLKLLSHMGFEPDAV
jgi:hypothetical protein